MSDNLEEFTITFPLHRDTLHMLSGCDMLVIPGTPEQIEFARQAAAKIVRDWHAQNGDQTPMPEALDYLINFLNRAMHVEKKQRGLMQ